MIFIILHVITYSIFFFISNYNKEAPWHSYERSNLWNLFWFYKTWWPNWCGMWIVFGVVRKRISVFVSFFYMLSLMAENFWIGWDFREAFAEASLKSVSYYIFNTKMLFNFKDADDDIIHFSLFVAGIHLICQLMNYVEGKLYDRHKRRNL